MEAKVTPWEQHTANNPLFSIIVPVYNRPQEIEELLGSLAQQQQAPAYEVIIVEDGSSIPCHKQIDKWSTQIDLRYIVTPNGGPAAARNRGSLEAKAPWVIFLDSDVVLPQDYLFQTAQALEQNPQCDAYGGPDAAHQSFSTVQKAINYAMTSFLTTGGIRGGKKRLTKRYLPRSFNLGCKTEAFVMLRGFNQAMRFGEDIDFSMRLYEAGYRVMLLPQTKLYHKRRVNLKQFFKQVYNSGMARVQLSKLHPGSMRPVYLLPSIFTIGLVGWLLVALWIPKLWWAVLLLLIVIGGDAFRLTKDLQVALYAIPATLTQILGYGLGYLHAQINRLLKKDKTSAFTNTFYD